MRSVSRTVLVAVLLFFAAVSSFGRTRPLKGPVERIRAAVARDGVVRIIIGVDVPDYQPEGRLKGQAIAEQRRNIRATQQRVLSAHRHLAAVPGHQYSSLPLMAVDVDRATLEEMLEDDDVIAVEENTIMKPALRNTTYLIGMPNVWSLGVNGSGYAVAIFDTGVATQHDFLKSGSNSRVTFEGCFSTTTGSFQSTCPNGGPSSTVAGSGEPCDAVAAPDCGHGTAVAGVAAGYINAPPDNNGPLSGVAPGASVMSFKLVALFGAQNIFQLIDINAAIDYINTHYSSSFTNLVAINMSFDSSYNPGTFDHYVTRAQCSSAHPAFVQSVQAMRDRDIALVAATGNEALADKFSFPACMPGVIAVAATTKSDTVWPYSNDTSEVDLFAPGAGYSNDPGIYTSVLKVNDDHTIERTFSRIFTTGVPNEGTSLAAPHVAGAIAVLKQRTPLKTTAAIKDALVRTGTPIMDIRNFAVIPRINVELAADNTPPTRPTNVNAVGTSTTVSVTWNASADDHAVDHYVVYRRSTVTGSFQDVRHTTSTSFNDTGVTSGRMYEYYVVAYDLAQNASAASNHHYAITVAFTNDSIGDSVLIYGRHIGELRQAVDAWRRFASFLPQWSSYADATGFVTADNTNSLVSALNPARSALGMSNFTYSVSTTTPAPGVVVSRRHIQELRDALR